LILFIILIRSFSNSCCPVSDLIV
ncbi:hypothetical protein CON95_27350, partial [Bacillus toyonensis]